MNDAALRSRLTSLTESLNHTQQSIVRLSKLPSSEARSSAIADDKTICIEIGTEIHESLKEYEEFFEVIKQEFEDISGGLGWSQRRISANSERERDNSDLAGSVAKLGEDLKIARIHFRKAQLQARKNVEAVKRKEREVLFAGVQYDQTYQGSGNSRRKGQDKLSQDEVLLGASSDVTAALRRTHQLMSTELERSQFARETLETSTKELSTLTETYSNLDTLLSSSRSLVSTLLHSQKSDTWYLETAFYILIATIGWLVFRRIVYGPGWWLLYFPLRTASWVTASALSTLFGLPSAILGLGGAKNQSFVTAQVSSQTSVSSAIAAVDTPVISSTMSSSITSPASSDGSEQILRMQQQRRSEGNEKSLSDEVGDVVTASQQQNDVVGVADPIKDEEEGESSQGTVLRERTAEDGPPNPKKRMLEEPVVGDRPRDEL